jgi:hypothetical protein
VSGTKVKYCMLLKITRAFLILIPCIIEYLAIDKQMHWIVHFFIYTMAPTCFGKAMQKSGSDYAPSELLQRQYSRRQVIKRMIEPVYRRSSLHTTPVHRFYQMFNDLPPTIFKLKQLRRNLVAPWWWHCLAETCRSQIWCSCDRASYILRKIKFN